MAKPFFELIKDQLPAEVEKLESLGALNTPEISIDKEVNIPAPKFQFERVLDTEDLPEEDSEDTSKKGTVRSVDTAHYKGSEKYQYLKEVYFNLYNEYRMLPEIPVGWARFEKEDNPLVFNKKRILGEILDNITCLIAQEKLEEELLLYKTKLERIKNAIK